MSHANEEYIHQQEIEQATSEMMGTITALPSPISIAQHDYIIELMKTSVLANIQKADINRLLDEGNLTSDHANKLITALLENQKNPLDRVKDGELLLKSDLKIAVKKAVDDPNT